MKFHLRLLIAAAALAAAIAVGAISVSQANARAATTTRVPNVTGKRLDIAERQLEARGLIPVEKGGGIFGIIVKADWVVCIQTPSAGRSVRAGSHVTVFASRPGRC
jgi:beta-lactam-binding protein with PASTA domain